MMDAMALPQMHHRAQGTRCSDMSLHSGTEGRERSSRDHQHSQLALVQEQGWVLQLCMGRSCLEGADVLQQVDVWLLFLCSIFLALYLCQEVDFRGGNVSCANTAASSNPQLR